MEFHPVAAIFPLMEGPDLDALTADIREHGLREAIWTYEGKIVDGRNRYLACLAAGVEPRYREWSGTGSLVSFTLSLNLKRRHLSASQRAALAVEIEPFFAKEAKERQRKHGGTAPGQPATPPVLEKVPEEGPEEGPGVSGEMPASESTAPKRVSDRREARMEAAAVTGTHGQYVSAAKTVLSKAPDLFDKIKKGELTLTQARSQVRRQERRAQLKEKAALAATPDGSWNIICGDCTQELQALTERPRLIFLDPPYNQGVKYEDDTTKDALDSHEYLLWCEQWLNAAARQLTDDGSLWLLIPDAYAEEMAIRLNIAGDSGLRRRSWIVWYESFGQNVTRSFNKCHRHLFWYVRDPKNYIFNAEAVTRPSDRQAKYKDARANPNGKIWDDVWGINPPIPRLTGTCAERLPDFPTQLPLALLEPIVLCASNPGDLIVDAFNGSATTGVAALKHGRRYIGIDKSQFYVDLSCQRLLAVQAEVTEHDA